MDINQSSLSRTKVNKPGISRTGRESKAVSESGKTRERSASSPVSHTTQAELTEGQIVRGRVIDHRYNEVKLELEPAKQIVTAKLSGDVPIEIGSEAQFMVSEESADRLVLRFLPDGANTSDATIQKALTASGLPMNEQNRALVQELLKHTLPVDKQTLQMLVRLSHANRDVSPLTLVLLYKNHIPMTQANIRQFEAYQNGTGELLNNIHGITKSISELLDAETSTLSQEASTGMEAFPLPDGSIATDAAHQSVLPTLNGAEQGPARTISQAIDMNQQLLDILLSNHSESSQSLDPVDSLTALLSQYQLGDMTGEDMIALIKEQFPEIYEQITQSQVPLSEVNNSNYNPAVLSDIIYKLLKETSEATKTLQPLPGLLQPQELASFADQLRSMPSLRLLADQVAEGSINTTELLNSLQKLLPYLEEADAKLLMTSPEYRVLLERAFHDKWTITPEKLAKKSAVLGLYENLMEDSERLAALSKLSNAAKEDSLLQEPVNNIREKLQFLKDLNELYTFLPLPLQLKEQDVHGDLYVYTNKKDLHQKKNLSVLLHLDMEHLGSMNIHVRMDHNVVQAKFYLEDPAALSLISESMPALSEALMKKGYRLHSEVSQAYRKVDFSRDFIEDPVKEGELKRYSFDIRT
jgi:hypothetical protein